MRNWRREDRPRLISEQWQHIDSGLRISGPDGHSLKNSVLIASGVIVEAENYIRAPTEDTSAGPVSIAAEFELHENDPRYSGNASGLLNSDVIPEFRLDAQA